MYISSMSREGLSFQHRQAGRKQHFLTHPMYHRIADRFLSGCDYYDTSSLDRIAQISATQRVSAQYPCALQKTNKETTRWSLWKYLRLSCCKVRHQVFFLLVFCEGPQGHGGLQVFGRRKMSAGIYMLPCLSLCCTLQCLSFKIHLRHNVGILGMQGVDETKIPCLKIRRSWDIWIILDVQLDGSIAKRISIDQLRQESVPNTSLAFEHFKRNSLRRIVYTCPPHFH